MKVLYFARFRQIIGRGSDEIVLPTHVTTAGELLTHLCDTDNGCAQAFANLKTVKVAIDQAHADLGTSITSAREIAFFPPVTGG
jgi:sulfur-carrier protein